MLSPMEQRQEFAVKASLSFTGELIIEAPKPGAEDGPPVVHVLARRHPAGFSVVENVGVLSRDQGGQTRELRRHSWGQ